MSLGEKLQQEAARRGDFEVALEASPTEQATPASCMSHFEAYGAICPDPAGCALATGCARVARRLGVILVARQAVLTARRGAERLVADVRAEAVLAGPPTPRTTIGGTP